VLGSLILGFFVFPTPPVKAPMICCICSGVRSDGRGGAASLPLMSGLSVDVDEIVFLLVDTASVLSGKSASSSSGLSVSELAAREC